MNRINGITNVNMYLIVCIEVHCHCNDIASYRQFCSVFGYGKYPICFICTNSYVRWVGYIADQVFNPNTTTMVKNPYYKYRTGGYGHCFVTAHEDDTCTSMDD